MKTVKLIFCLLLLTITCGNIYAQTPNKFNFQGLARDANGNAVVNQTLKLRFTIRDSVGTGTILYQETRNATTDANGLFATVIGGGGATNIKGSLDNINWALYNKFLQTEMQIGSSGGFTKMGVTQFLSVPYAEEARKADTTKFATYTTSLKTSLTDASSFNGDNVAGNATVVISFSNNSFNDTSFNSTTHEYTAPSSGNYLIAFNVNLTQLSNGGKLHGTLAIRVNGSNTLYTQSFWYPQNTGAISYNFPLSGSYVRYLTAGQKVTLAVSNGISSSDASAPFNVLGNNLEIFKIGNR